MKFKAGDRVQYALLPEGDKVTGWISCALSDNHYVVSYDVEVLGSIRWGVFTDPNAWELIPTTPTLSSLQGTYRDTQWTLISEVHEEIASGIRINIHVCKNFKLYEGLGFTTVPYHYCTECGEKKK